MPFTFSHPAIVLPLALLPRKWISLTGLVVGSLLPDFEYFLRMRIESQFSHTIPGVLWFNLPLGILITFLFHVIVRDALIDNLPSMLKSRLFVFKQFDWRGHFKENWIVVSISVIVGTVSHILWDAFTHEHGYFVEAFPVLSTMTYVLDEQIPIYRLLQHGSTFVGALVIAVVLLRLPHCKIASKDISLKYWIILIGLSVIITALRLWIGLEYRSFGHLIATAIAAVLISLILTPLILQRISRFTDTHVS